MKHQKLACKTMKRLFDSSTSTKHMKSMLFSLPPNARWASLFSKITIVLFVGLLSCIGPDSEDNPAPEVDHSVQLDAVHKITVYKNQTGDVTTEALQAHLVAKGKYTVNFYGTFDSNRNPDKLRSISFKKDDNDTTVYLLLNRDTGKLQTAYLAVKGVKQPWVIRHEYLADNDKAIKISIHDYDWVTQNAELKYEAIFENKGGVISQTPVYGLRKSKAAGFGTDLATGIGAGILAAEVAFYGSGTGIMAALPASVVASGGTVVAIGGAVIALTAIVDLLLQEAGAAEITPGDYPYPQNTPVTNPATGQNDPTGKIPTSDCGAITFSASMDAEGSIMVWGVEGGTSPYQFDVAGSGFQPSEVFTNDYEDGSYLITIKDAQGCIGVAVVNLKRENDATFLVGNWSLTEFNGVPANQYQVIHSCPANPSPTDTYAGYTMYGSASFTKDSFSCPVGRSQVYRFCLTNQCAGSNLCYDNPNSYPHSGTYESKGNKQFVVTSNNGGAVNSTITVVDENTIIVTQLNNKKKYIRQ